MFVSLRFLAKKQTLRRNLFIYMLLLVLTISVVILAGLFFLGQSSNTKEKVSDLLSLQMEVFSRDVSSHHESVVARGIRLSEESSQILNTYLEEQQLEFSDLENSSTHLYALQEQFLTLLGKELPFSQCSGALIMLDATVNSSLPEADTSKSGVYIQQNSSSLDQTMLLYHGNASLGKSHKVMPHRKWKLEFDSSIFPDYEQIMETGKSLPLYKTYRTTSPVTLQGTYERVMYVLLPIRDKDLNVRGICGFEMNASSFKSFHSQPTTLDHLICTLSPSGDMILAEQTFSSGVLNGYYLSQSGDLKKKYFGKDLYSFEGEKESYIGAYRSVTLSYNEYDDFAFAVMIPKGDYDRMVFRNGIFMVIFLLLLLFFAVVCCWHLSARYITPIKDSLEEIKHSRYTAKGDAYVEIDDLFSFLEQKDQELSQAQSKVESLSYSRKTEIDPDDYAHFVAQLKSLTKTEQKIFQLYLDGKTGKEILEELHIKESTLKYHNHNLYEKLGVSSRKQMIRYAIIYKEEQEK